MSKIELNQEEKSLLEAYENGELESVLTPERERQLREAAGNTSAENERISIQIPSKDLEAIKKIALVEGIPYQTLVSSILRKYVSSTLYDATAGEST